MFDNDMEKVFDEIENRLKETKERYRNMEITKDGIKKIIDDPRSIRLASMFGISKEMLEDYYDNYCDKCHSSPCVCKKEEKDNDTIYSKAAMEEMNKCHCNNSGVSEESDNSYPKNVISLDEFINNPDNQEALYQTFREMFRIFFRDNSKEFLKLFMQNLTKYNTKD